MNERVKELHLRAGLWASDQLPFTNPEWVELRDKKFAELIVRECGNYINSRVPGNLEVSATVAKMRQHFGVGQ